MKVLLREDVENLGLAGEVYEVANGYGRNFLLPKGYAVKASPGVMNQAAVWRTKAEARRAEIHAQYEALAVKISEVTLSYTARASETGKLFGSVTTVQIADDLNAQLGTEIDRRKVGVEPLRQLGEHKVVVRLSGQIQPELTVIIESEEAPPVVVKEVIEEVDEFEDDYDDYDDYDN